MNGIREWECAECGDRQIADDDSDLTPGCPECGRRGDRFISHRTDVVPV